jgi:hypothetical protein
MLERGSRKNKLNVLRKRFRKKEKKRIKLKRKKKKTPEKCDPVPLFQYEEFSL